MAGKFGILTTLTLNAAGFNDGINKATKGAKALGEGVKTAGGTMMSAFSGIDGIVGDITGQLGGITSAALGGVSAFTKMVPAINGIKVALISTGIGAIVVALGTAFAALMSYLKGTEEGSNKLAKVLGFLKGTFNAILQRVQLLGEAVSLVFEGKFKQAGEKLKEAFKGGLLEEIKADAKEAVGYAERENKLWRDKLDWGYKEANLLKELNKQKLIAEDKSNSIEKRQQAINSAISIQKQISAENNRLATEEYEILRSKNAMGNNSRADSEAELELYKKKEQVLADEYSKLKEMTAKRNEIIGSQKTELDNIKKLNEVDKVRINNLNVLAGTGIKPLNLDKTQLQEYKGTISSISDEIIDLSVVIQNNLINAIDSLSDSFLQGGNSFKDYAKNIKSAIKQTIGAFIAEGVAAMVGGALKSSAKLGPVGLALAPALAAMAGGLAKTAFNSLIPNFTFGGIVPGTSFSGDKVPAMVNSGEMILNGRQQRNLFDMISGGGSGFELQHRIEGSDLLLWLNNINRKNMSFA